MLEVAAGVANLLALIPVSAAVVIAVKLRKPLWAAIFFCEFLLILYALTFTLDFALP